MRQYKLLHVHVFIFKISGYENIIKFTKALQKGENKYSMTVNS